MWSLRARHVRSSGAQNVSTSPQSGWAGAPTAAVGAPSVKSRRRRCWRRRPVPMSPLISRRTDHVHRSRRDAPFHHRRERIGPGAGRWPGSRIRCAARGRSRVGKSTLLLEVVYRWAKGSRRAVRLGRRIRRTDTDACRAHEVQPRRGSTSQRNPMCRPSSAISRR